MLAIAPAQAFNYDSEKIVSYDPFNDTYEPANEIMMWFSLKMPPHVITMAMAIMLVWLVWPAHSLGHKRGCKQTNKINSLMGEAENLFKLKGRDALH